MELALSAGWTCLSVQLSIFCQADGRANGGPSLGAVLPASRSDKRCGLGHDVQRVGLGELRECGKTHLFQSPDDSRTDAFDAQKLLFFFR